MIHKPSLEEENSRVLADLAIDSETSEDLRVKIIQKLLDNTQSNNFFGTMFNERLSFGACPNCNHENFWLIPENNLNEFGWITHQKDDRVLARTKTKDCKRFSEACKKKKIHI